MIFACLALIEKELYPELLFFQNSTFQNTLNIFSEEKRVDVNFEIFLSVSSNCDLLIGLFQTSPQFHLWFVLQK